MLLAIDCGNTNIVFTLFEGQTKLSEWRLETVSRRPADEYFIALCHVLDHRSFITPILRIVSLLLWFLLSPITSSASVKNGLL